eukprot:TRINITY_DN5701_c0_g1_i1.p1 TRINITY_DN5701_c0_g1~~TRINITY_DN5701_c0_g1_i1.p1  ORF type:complete len:517 (-),score=82.99 TRINITY_DN5701_c0_g1_i1:31-1581(-)
MIQVGAREAPADNRRQSVTLPHQTDDERTDSDLHRYGSILSSGLTDAAALRARMASDLQTRFPQVRASFLIRSTSPQSQALKKSVSRNTINSEATRQRAALDIALVKSEFDNQSRAIHLSNALFLLSWLSIGVTIAALEVKDRSYDLFPNPVTTTLYIILSCLSVITCGLLIAYYHLELVRLRMRNPLFVHASLYQTPLFKFLLLELLINAFHIPPFVDGATFGTYYSTLDRFNVIVICRLYSGARFLRDHSQLVQQTGKLIGAFVNLPSSSIFVLKTLFYNRPAIMLTSLLLFVLFAVSYALHVFERTVSWDTYSFSNSLWLVFVSVTTVGYGDIVPSTFVGRVIVSIGTVLGLVLSALLISVTHTHLMTMSRREEQLVRLLDDQKQISEYRNYAARSLQMFFRVRLLARRRKLSAGDSREESRLDALTASTTMRMNVYLDKFRKLRRLRATYTAQHSLLDNVMSVCGDMYTHQQQLEDWTVDLHQGMQKRFDDLDFLVRGVNERLAVLEKTLAT